MHIITQKRIWEAKKIHPTSASSLDGWLRIISRNTFMNFTDLKQTFGSIDKVNDYYVFDIGGNKLRFITKIHFNRQKIYIRNILTHKDYDKNHWKKENHYE
jgi:mRNA interferase HigB